MTKLNPTGTALVYSTYLGGTGVGRRPRHRRGYRRQRLRDGIHYFHRLPDHGRRLSDDLWRRPADAFVTKLNPTGTALVYSTYLGGTDSDIGYGIAVDTDGNAYVTGETDSIDFPTTPGAYQTTYGGGHAMPS